VTQVQKLLNHGIKGKTNSESRVSAVSYLKIKDKLSFLTRSDMELDISNSFAGKHTQW